MNFTPFKFIVPVIFSFTLLACNTKSEPSAAGTVQDQPSHIVVGTPAVANQASYFYEPVVSLISGTLTVERFYGPPGFGEDTLHDSREDSYVLLLEAPIDVKPEAQASDDFNVPKEGVFKIQLTSAQGISFREYKDKEVELRGTLFGAHTGHHHTDVLMEVQEIQ